MEREVKRRKVIPIADKPADAGDFEKIAFMKALVAGTAILRLSFIWLHSSWQAAFKKKYFCDEVKLDEDLKQAIRWCKRHTPEQACASHTQCIAVLRSILHV